MQMMRASELWLTIVESAFKRMFSSIYKSNLTTLDSVNQGNSTMFICLHKWSIIV